MAITWHLLEIDDATGKISTRYVISLLGSVGLGIIYGFRVNFNVAIISMVNHTAVSAEGGDDSEDAAEDGPFVWSKYIQGFLLSSYFWGYLAAQLPGGRIAESFSAKWVLFFSIAMNVGPAILTPLSAEMHYIAVIVMRVLQGIGGGVIFPGMHVMLSHWAPPSERSVMSNIVYSGSALGTVIFTLGSGIIAAKLGWIWVFYIEGGASAIWLVFWFIFAYDFPATHKFISEEEKEYIMTSLNQTAEGSTSREKKKVPWKAIMLSPPFLAILVAHMCSNWGWYMVLVELPLYMKTVLKFKLSDNSFLTSLPFLTMWIFSMIISKLMDYLRSKGIITTTMARKIATGVASVGPMICFVLLCFLDGQTTSVVLMTLAVTAIGAMFCAFLSNHIDISPNFAGTLMAVTNTLATIPGIAVPFVISALTEKDPSINTWRKVFAFTVVLYVIEFVVYSLFASGEEQKWNKPDSETSAEPEPK